MDSSDLGTVGPYELLLQLAKGGMAEVFIARRACAAGGGDAGGAGGAAGAGCAGLERESLVAVKRIRADLRYESSYSCMLFDEAGIASRVASPHFVPVLDYGLDEGAPYIVMELVVGSPSSTSPGLRGARGRRRDRGSSRRPPRGFTRRTRRATARGSCLR